MATPPTLRHSHRGFLAATFAASNPTLYARELAIETDTRRFKFGDGATAWNALPYAVVDQVDDGNAIETGESCLIMDLEG